jgi:TonB family protein
MTTPSQTLSIAAIVAATVLGVVLLVGALGIPVPTVNLNIQLGARSIQTPDQTPTVTHFDVPPTPPPPPPSPIVLRSDIPGQELVIIRSTEGEMVGYRLDEVSGASAPQPLAEPRFTPMTVRPMLMNASEVSSAMSREYPPVLRDAGIGGVPLLWLHIDETGAVDGTRIHESSGYGALDEAAMRVARAMRFVPAQNDEGITDAWVQLPIRFQAVN